jgi:hypothetical protein
VRPENPLNTLALWAANVFWAAMRSADVTYDSHIRGFGGSHTAKLSSMTTLSRGEAHIFSAANRKLSGAGLSF